MTNMSVQFTAEGTFLAGRKPTVVANASATRPLETPVSAVSATHLHEAALATIGDLYGVIAPTADDLS